MKVLILIPYPENGAGNNLYRKFTSQIECTKKIVDNVSYTSYDDENLYFNTNNDEKIIIGATPKKKQNFLIMHEIMRCVRKQLESFSPDLVYMRSITPSNSYKKTMKLIYKCGGKLVVEIPTYPGNQESKNSSRKLFFATVKIMNTFFCKGSYGKYTDLYTIIGEECHQYRGKPAINIQNGLNVESVPVKKGFEKRQGELHLLGVAALSYWHGYDRVLAGLKQYYNLNIDHQKVYFHICGESYDGTKEKMIDYVKENGLEEFVTFEGFLSGHKLTQLFDNCDIAIGSLGLHRQDIVIDTTLKLPEYTSRGIPFVYATKSDLIGENQFSFMIPKDDSPLDIVNLIKFYEKIDKENVILQMRHCALTHVDWSTQINKVIKKIHTL